MTLDGGWQGLGKRLEGEESADIEEGSIFFVFITLEPRVLWYNNL